MALSLDQVQEFTFNYRDQVILATYRFTRENENGDPIRAGQIWGVINLKWGVSSETFKYSEGENILKLSKSAIEEHLKSEIISFIEK